MYKTQDKIHAVIDLIDGQIEELQRTKQTLQHLVEQSKDGAWATVRKGLSPEARDRIAQAQLKRWARYRAENANANPIPAPAEMPRRKRGRPRKYPLPESGKVAQAGA